MELLTLLLLWVNVTPPVPPPVTLADLRLFPALDVATRGTTAAWHNHGEMYRNVPAFLNSAERDDYVYWVEDAWNRWFVWDDLKIALTDTNSLEYRLMALRRLREWIGPEAYYAGSLPPPVPFWRVFPR